MSQKRTAIYCRVDRGGSAAARQAALAAQRQLLEQYARAEGLTISGHYEDNGFPGHDLNRPGLLRLEADHRAGAFEQVLVVSYGRLYRGSRRDEPRWPFPVCALSEDHPIK